MTNASATGRRIVVGVDGSEPGRVALRWALREAGIRNAEVHAVHVWSYPSAGGLAGLPISPSIDLHETAEGRLREEVDTAVAASGSTVAVHQHVVEGGTAHRLMEVAEDADLLVVGARGLGGFAALVLGSVSQQAAHHAKVPVAIIRDHDDRIQHGRVVVGIDGSDASMDALRWAADEARQRTATLRVVLAWSFLDQPAAPGGDRPFDPSFDQAAAEAVLDEILDAEPDLLEGLEVERHAICDLPARALLDQSATADLIVVGARGRGGFTRLTLGSVSHQVAQHAPAPVVVVRPH